MGLSARHLKQKLELETVWSETSLLAFQHRRLAGKGKALVGT